MGEERKYRQGRYSPQLQFFEYHEQWSDTCADSPSLPETAGYGCTTWAPWNTSWHAYGWCDPATTSNATSPFLIVPRPIIASR